MYSITVQGVCTGGFQFRNNSGQEFRSLIESMVLNYVTLICSPYRIDLIYYSDQNRQEEVIKTWCKVIGKEFTSSVSKRFLKSEGLESILENYFTSLLYLSRIPEWFQQYSRQFNLTTEQEPNHPIHKKILDCARFLASRQSSIKFPLTITNHHSLAYYLLKDHKDFAIQAAKNYLNN